MHACMHACAFLRGKLTGMMGRITLHLTERPQSGLSVRSQQPPTQGNSQQGNWARCTFVVRLVRGEVLGKAFFCALDGSVAVVLQLPLANTQLCRRRRCLRGGATVAVQRHPLVHRAVLCLSAPCVAAHVFAEVVEELRHAQLAHSAPLNPGSLGPVCTHARVHLCVIQRGAQRVTAAQAVMRKGEVRRVPLECVWARTHACTGRDVCQ
jgi:hypothetical protein